MTMNQKVFDYYVNKTEKDYLIDLYKILKTL